MVGMIGREGREEEVMGLLLKMGIERMEEEVKEKEGKRKGFMRLVL